MDSIIRCKYTKTKHKGTFDVNTAFIDQLEKAFYLKENLSQVSRSLFLLRVRCCELHGELIFKVICYSWNIFSAACESVSGETSTESCWYTLIVSDNLFFQSPNGIRGILKYNKICNDAVLVDNNGIKTTYCRYYELQ